MKRWLSLLVVGVLACSEGDNAPLSPPGPPGGPAPPGEPPAPTAGPAPHVEVSIGFGDSPVEGEVFLSPPAESGGWRYEIDLDEDGQVDRRGDIGLGIGFSYRFTSPGIHVIRTTLSGPGDRTIRIESPVIVNDPAPIRILAQAQVPPVDPDWRSFEGIAMSHSGDALYVAAYRGGSLHRVDPASLSVTGVIEEMGYSIEGISVSPKDSFLFAAYKYHHAASVDLASFEIDRFFERGVGGKFFIQAVDERHALIGGEGTLGLVDMKTGETVNRFRAPGDEFTSSWHFAVSPDGATAAVITYDSEGEYALHLVEIATLQSLRTIALGSLEYPQTVAFHPDGSRLYAIGYAEEGVVFSAFELTRGELLHEIRLDAPGCTGYCVANPTATLVSGRYVAFEWSGGAYFIDTRLDLPVHAISPLACICGFSVTASPVEDVFFFLRSDGLVQKVAIGS